MSITHDMSCPRCEGQLTHCTDHIACDDCDSTFGIRVTIDRNRMERRYCLSLVSITGIEREYEPLFFDDFRRKFGFEEEWPHRRLSMYEVDLLNRAKSTGKTPLEIAKEDEQALKKG